MKSVVILQEFLPHYRKPFFEGVREVLLQNEIELSVIYSEQDDERFVVDPVTWASAVPVRKIGPFVLHRPGIDFRKVDLVIVPQEVKYLLSHWLQFKSWFGKSTRFAFWGHGRNFQKSQESFSFPEWVKKKLSLRVHWWFAYNDLSAEIVRALGFPENRISNLRNTVDTSAMLEARDSFGDAELRETKEALGIASKNIAVFTGGLYHQKRLEFLLESAKLVKERVSDFELIVIGAGPQRNLVEDEARNHNWIHYLGKLNDVEKVPYWAISQLVLMPGLVGLVVIDSFALGVPIVTTDYPFHSPEFSYLTPGVNGLVVSPWTSAEAYCNAVCDLLIDEVRLGELQNATRESAENYTMKNMISTMASGIISALKAD